MSTSSRMMQTVRRPWALFAAAFALAVAGFWPSFFARLPATPLPHHIHGWSATAWMLLPLLQYALIRSRRRDLHRQLGYASLVLAIIVAVSGVYVVHLMAARNITHFELVSVKFVWIDLTGIALFAVYVGVALVAARRRDIPLHIAALAASAFIPLEAALERLSMTLLPSVVPDFDVALTASLMTLEAACVTLTVIAWRARRLRWPIPVLLCYYAFMHLSAGPVARSATFQQLSLWVGTVGRTTP